MTVKTGLDSLRGRSVLVLNCVTFTIRMQAEPSSTRTKSLVGGRRQVSR